MSKYDMIDKLVDMTLEDKKCPDGYRWCTFTKKCVPEGQEEKGTGRGLGRGQGKGPIGRPHNRQGLGRGQGQGPIGRPYNRQNELLAADFPGFTKVEKKVDKLNEWGMLPEDHRPVLAAIVLGTGLAMKLFDFIKRKRKNKNNRATTRILKIIKTHNGFPPDVLLPTKADKYINVYFAETLKKQKRICKKLPVDKRDECNYKGMMTTVKEIINMMKKAQKKCTSLETASSCRKEWAIKIKKYEDDAKKIERNYKQYKIKHSYNENITEDEINIRVDELIDISELNMTKSIPDEDPEELLKNIHDDIAGYGDPEDIENEYPPGPQDKDFGEDDSSGIGSQLEFILKEEEYKNFFKSMMDKEGINSLNDLSDDKKKEFFNKVDSMWKGKNESLQEKGEYHTFFKRMMDEEGISSIGQLSHDRKSSFFSKVSAGWKKKKGKGVAETFSELI